jgi:hypothetical protein
MSQPTIPYMSSTVHPPSNRPTAVTVLAIIGIVFGALGVLCIGSGDVMLMFSFMSANLNQGFAGQSMGLRLLGLFVGVLSLGLSGVLLWASIASLGLKPFARRLMIGWALADIAFDAANLVYKLLIQIHVSARNSAFRQNPAFQNNPTAPQVLQTIKVVGIIMAIVVWLIGTTYAALVYIYFRKPEIIAAFESPPPNLNPSSPMPPPPI